MPEAIGDLNGDQASNLSDAVYLLNWLFRSGPEPVLGQGSEGSSALPATGQTLCYDSSGAVIDCASATCPGQDGFYQTGCPMDGPDGSGRFLDNGDGTVSDNCTGLTWQKETADVKGDGTVDVLRWCEALAYCESLSFAGHDDWRLPNVRELQSLVDHGRACPAIDPIFGVGEGNSVGYWSSTPALNITFVCHGRVDAPPFKDTALGYVRAVRAGP